MAAVHNREGFEPFSNRTFVALGDGCARGGEASEAASLDGRHELGNLIALYDNDYVCIDGDINSTVTEDVLKRLETYGWHTQHVAAGNTNLVAISRAIDFAVATKDKPSVIKIIMTMGFGSLSQGTGNMHGSPLKSDNIKQFTEKTGTKRKHFMYPKRSVLSWLLLKRAL